MNIIDFEWLTNIILNILDELGLYSSNTNSEKVETNIKNILISFAVAVPSLIFIYSMIIKHLFLDSFDIKLFHKKDHLVIQTIKNLTILAFASVWFGTLEFLFYVLMKQITFIQNALMLLLAFALILTFLFWIYTSIHWIICRIINIIKKLFNNPTSTNPIWTITKWKQFKEKHQDIYLFILIFVFGTMGAIQFDLILGDSEKTTEASDYLILLCLIIMPTIILMMFNKYIPTRHKLLKVTKDKPNYELFLEYFINDDTSVLTNNKKTIRVIKKNVGEYHLYEIYEVVKTQNIET
ncbi:hypothetical protein [Psychrobacillus sp. BM2]|uniref:hypothetical protein n=1 Tax=Psychrobacillus sp. BM2 TaxID=3400421 RepID=UPI003B024BC9